MNTLRLIWAAMIAGVVFYTLLVVGLTLAGMGPAGAVSPSILTYAGAAVMVYMASGVFTRRRLVAQIDQTGSAEERIAAYTLATIIGIGLTESGGLGLVSLALLAGSASWALAGGLATVFLMLMARPDGAEVGLD